MDDRARITGTPLPARYRKTIRARLHYLAWTLFLILLWPVSWLFRIIEKTVRHGR